MFYGLSYLEDEFFAKHLYKAVQFAPCFYTKNIYNDTIESVNDMWNLANEHGMYSTFGPNWERNFKTICDKFPKKLCDLYEMMAQYGGQGMSWKTSMHFM